MKKIKSGEITMQLRHRIFSLVIVPFAVLALTSCSDDPSTKNQDSIVTAGPVSNYDLAESIIPFPNDLLFAPNEAAPMPDGTINIPVVDPADLSDPKVAMNGLDGFSTVAPMSTGFSDALDPASINGTSVRLFKVTLQAAGPFQPGNFIADAEPQLIYGVDYVAAVSSVDITGSTLVILPLKPLVPKTNYAVLITKGLTGTDGKSVAISNSYALTRGTTELVVSPPSSPISNDDILIGSLKADVGATEAEIAEAYTTAATLDGLRVGLVQPSEAALLADTDAGNGDITSADVILHWGFTTQSTTDVLAQVRIDVKALTPAAGFGPTGETSKFGAADIHVGSLTVPYYLTAAANVNDPAPLGSFWKGAGDSFLTYLAPNPGCTTGANVCPVETSTQIIPTMISTPIALGPCSPMPVDGWPVVIYQHGITTNRATMLAVADAMAGACMAVVAIDMPMHGLTGNETNGTEAFHGVPVSERTFELDLVTQDADGNITAEGPDGVTDTSGRHFINLSNLQNTRDNVRQAVSDLFALVDAIEEGVLADISGNKMDPANIFFLGHSLGAMVGTVFTALEPNVQDAVFVAGGASIPKILDGSAAFGPSIAAGLAANGVVKGTPDYEAFLGAAQTVVDSGDPVNHATTAAQGRGILFFEIVGGNSSPSDLVVPNRVPDGNDTTGTVPAPLAGTEPQLALMGLTHVNETQAPGSGKLAVVTKYISGSHSSLLDPGPDAAVTTEMQTQAAIFLANQGTLLVVTDNTVLQAPAP